MQQTGSLLVLGKIQQVYTGSLQVATGNTVQRPSSANAGMIRFNTDLGRLEAYYPGSTTWSNIGLGDGSVSTVTTNTTGIAASLTAGALTVGLSGELVGVNALATLGYVQRTAAGTYTTNSVIPVANGGTGATTIPGIRAMLSVPGVYRQSFSNTNVVANTVVISHNLGQQFVSGVIVTDNTNTVVFPDTVYMTNSTALTLDLTSWYTIMTGTWNVTVSG